MPSTFGRRTAAPKLRGKNWEWLNEVFDVVGEGEFDIYLVQKIIFDAFREEVKPPTLRKWNEDQWIEVVRVPDKPPKAHIYKIRKPIIEALRAKKEGRRIMKRLGMGIPPFSRERSPDWRAPWERSF